MVAMVPDIVNSPRVLVKRASSQSYWTFLCLARLPSALSDIRLTCRVFFDSSQAFNDSNQVSSSFLKTCVGAPNRFTY
jgi:hypothetical protein